MIQGMIESVELPEKVCRAARRSLHVRRSFSATS